MDNARAAAGEEPNPDTWIGLCDVGACTRCGGGGVPFVRGTHAKAGSGGSGWWIRSMASGGFAIGRANALAYGLRVCDHTD